MKDHTLNIWIGALVLVLLATTTVAGQERDVPPTAEGSRPLSLAEALAAAGADSEELAVAEAGVLVSQAEVTRATAARLPQLGASASYSRTLASQFEGLGGGGPTEPIPPACQGPFVPDPSASLTDRVSDLETQLGCPPSGGFGGIDFNEIGFGSENTYNLGLSLSWNVFSGGRLQAQSRIARAGRDAAEIGVSAAEAQLRLDVTEAYFDAQLSDRLLAIALSTQEQLDEALRLTELRAEVGTQAEFEVVRARVASQNQRPVVIQRRSQRQLAYDALAMLLNLPPDEPLDLTTSLEAVEPAELEAVEVARRAPVRQAEEAVEVQRGLVRVARSQRLPNINLTSQYGQVAYSGLVPEFGDFRENWTVGAALQVPVFNGGRIRGDIRAAQAGLMEAEARLRQAREAAQLDTRSALAQLDAAEAVWIASQGTVEEAERAYDIATLRFEEGISTQIELTDARILLEQAQANRAQAARDLRVALTRVDLLPDLPLTGSGGFGGAPGSGAGPSAGVSAGSGGSGRGMPSDSGAGGSAFGGASGTGAGAPGGF